VRGAYPRGSETSIMVSWKGSLFNYFFASCWLNFSDRGPDLHPAAPCDIWANDRQAILANRQFCIDHAASPGSGDGRFSTYGENAWGLTACDNLVSPETGLAGEYFPFGALPSEENILFGTKALHSGTLAVYGAVSCINFVPEAAIAAVRHYFTIPGLWNPLFGFGDAFSLDPHYVTGPYDHQGNPTIQPASHLNGPWINHTVMGINTGPLLLAIENYRSHMIWQLTARNPEITAGLDGIFGSAVAHRVARSVDRKSGAYKVKLSWRRQSGHERHNIYGSNGGGEWNLLEKEARGTTWTGYESRTATPCTYLVRGVR
jgi:hypothetical protein